MVADLEPVNPGEADWVATQRKWTSGWRRFVMPAAFLAYLVYVGGSVAQYSHGAARVVGYAILVAFAAFYLLAVAMGPEPTQRRFWTNYAILFALAVAILPFARAPGFVLCLYIVTITVARFGVRAAPVVFALAVASLLVPLAIPSWHDSLADSFGTVVPVAIPVVALVTLAMLKVMEGNRALAEARAELARLAAENERFRIARDLHDLLGHSLTTITVKAGLARQLGESDPVRAVEEIAEVESLSRQSLADVRAAVSSYRDVTLAGELATGRELLRAAGVNADLPRAVDAVEPANRELFGWVVREGLTNVVRHAHASSCAVRLSASSVEIVDNGTGGTGRLTNGDSPHGHVGNGHAGNGLDGLRERVEAAGGVLAAGPLSRGGWRVKVTLAREQLS